MTVVIHQLRHSRPKSESEVDLKRRGSPVLQEHSVQKEESGELKLQRAARLLKMKNPLWLVHDQPKFRPLQCLQRRDLLLPRSQHLIEGVLADGGSAGGRRGTVIHLQEIILIITPIVCRTKT